MNFVGNWMVNLVRLGALLSDFARNATARRQDEATSKETVLSALHWSSYDTTMPSYSIDYLS